MNIKKSLLLLVTVALLFSCKQEEIVDQNTGTADLSLDISQYDTANLGLYKGTFTTNDASERGIVEVKILDSAPSRATLTLSSGAIYNLQSTETVASDQDVTNLRFVSIVDLALPVSFDFSVGSDGTGADITSTFFGGLDASILIAKETSRAPVVPITGTYLCTACGTHPNLGTVTQTFNMVYTGNGSDDDTIMTEMTLGTTVYTSTASENSQPFCAPSPTNPGFNDCSISGTTMVNAGGPLITWSGKHTYDASAINCSQVGGSWTYVSSVYGNLAGTFTSDIQCLPIVEVGDLRAGGVVFWVDQVDKGHGLVCAMSDYVSTREWGCNETDLPSVPNVPFNGGIPVGSGAEIGDGITNTNGILNVTDCPDAPAAFAARTYGPDWFLPSVKELGEMYQNKATLETVPGFDSFVSVYWSSTEFSFNGAWFQNFSSGTQSGNFKGSAFNVRAVRAF